MIDVSAEEYCSILEAGGQYPISPTMCGMFINHGLIELFFGVGVHPAWTTIHNLRLAQPSRKKHGA